MSGGRIIQNLLHNYHRLSARRLSFLALPHTRQNPSSSSSSSCLCGVIDFSLKPTSLFSPSLTLRFLNTTSTQDKLHNQQDLLHYDTTEEGETTDGWEEEDEVEAKIGDGGDGGGVVLQDVPWGERALSIAHEVLSQLGDDMKLYSFKTTPRGYVYVRLDKLSNE